MTDSKLDAICRLEDKARELRNTTLEMCARAGSGHLTSSFSCAEILAVLYFGGILRFDPANPKWPERDRFILSKGQASPILYAALSSAGFFPSDWLETFCAKDGHFGVHLQDTVPGVEITCGSLGHGLGIAAGMALAARLNPRLKPAYNAIVLLGDGELYEGSNWETAMFASQAQLGNLTAIVDRNGLCATDFTESAIKLEPLAEKWRAFGWRVYQVNGHSVPQLMEILSTLCSRAGDQPAVVIADTVKGKGAPSIENKVFWHARAPKGDEIAVIREEINS